MLCISIAQESRRMALADMLNAAPQCGLLELRLDRFAKAPDLGELLAARPRPVIMSCRRRQDGGRWAGTEAERLALLRQCVVSKAEYVEIELDVADQIRRLPPAKRVIAYTNLRETPADIAALYAQAQKHDPDVIKLTTLARTPEEAWPLVQLLAKPPVPTVVVGLGKPGVMLTILGKKIGAPWAYAALERGMEAHPDQPTVRDLNEVYHYAAIDKATRFVGVTGFGERQRQTTAGLNAAFAHLGAPARCLPLGVGDARLFRRIAEAVKAVGVVVDKDSRRLVLEMATELEPSAKQAQSADLVLYKNDAWHGYHTGSGTQVRALEDVLQNRYPSAGPFQGRVVVVVGTNVPAQVLAREVRERGGAVIIASRDREAAHELAQEVGCRYVPVEAVYSLLHDVLILCDDEAEQAHARKSDAGVHPGYLKASMAVMDLTTGDAPGPLLQEAQRRGCAVVTPRDLLLAQLEEQVRLLTGERVPRDVLTNALPEEET